MIKFDDRMIYKASVLILMWCCSYAVLAQNSPVELGQMIGTYLKKAEVDSIEYLIPTPQEVMAYARLEIPSELLEDLDSTGFANSYKKAKKSLLQSIKATHLKHDALFWQTATIKSTSEQQEIRIGEGAEVTMEITQLDIEFRTDNKVVALTFGQIFELNSRWFIGDHGFKVSVNEE